MKRIPYTIIGLMVMTLAVFILHGCSRSRKPAIAVGIDACSLCNMVIDRPNQACGFFLGMEFITFDAPSCLLKSYDALRKEGVTIPDEIYFTDFESGAFYLADATTFLLTDHIPTVMNARVVCFGDKATAGGFVKHDDEKFVNWMDFRLARSDPDRQQSILIDGEGMHPESIELNKGELVELIVQSENLKDAVTLAIKGYDNAGEISVPVSGDQVSFRMWASRPGAGFPVIDTSNNNPVGMIKVAGAHTLDEEAQ